MEIDKVIKKPSSFTIDNVIQTFQRLGITAEQDVEVLDKLVQSIDFQELLIENPTKTVTQMKYESMHKLHPDKARQALFEEMTALVSKQAIKGISKSETYGPKVQYVMLRYVEI